MFVLFGVDNLGNERNDFFVMDTVHKQWINSYLANGQYESSGVLPGSPSGLSIGSIVGIAVGSLVSIRLS